MVQTKIIIIFDYTIKYQVNKNLSVCLHLTELKDKTPWKLKMEDRL